MFFGSAAGTAIDVRAVIGLELLADGLALFLDIAANLFVGHHAFAGRRPFALIRFIPRFPQQAVLICQPHAPVGTKHADRFEGLFSFNPVDFTSAHLVFGRGHASAGRAMQRSAHYPRPK